jgi:uncharacterized protein YndB with AHSA1/START domain
MSQSNGTVRLHRVFKCPAERLYRAFFDPKALVKWMAPNGYVSEVQSIDAKVGGGYRMSFTSFANNEMHAFGGKYIELRPNELIRYTDKFDDPNMPGEMQMTVKLREVTPAPGMTVTELTIVQENIPAMIPVEMCYLGWQDSLELLKRVVEG